MAINDDIKNYLEDVKADLIAAQTRQGRRVSGYSAASLRVQQSRRSGGQFTANWELVGVGYWATLFRGIGRKPGKFAPPREILKWVRQKNITFQDKTPRQTAFLINRKLKEEGSLIFRDKRRGIRLDEILKKHEPTLVTNVGKSIVQEYEKRLNQIIIS